MLWSCLECSTRYALDLRACPHCGSARREEDDMPKISVHGGASDAQYIVKDQPTAEVPAEGSERPSAGSSSSTSPQKTASTSKKSAATRPRRARMTESHSSPDPEVNSSAPGTAGGTAEAEGSGA